MSTYVVRNGCGEVCAVYQGPPDCDDDDAPAYVLVCRYCSAPYDASRCNNCGATGAPKHRRQP